MNDKMQRHIHNLKKSAGLSGNGSVKYEYILTKDQLHDAYLKRMDDLGYPLRVEPKRDRYVMNSQALKKALEDASTKALEQVEDEINTFVNNEVMNVIEQETWALLNSFNFANGQYTMNRRPIKKSNWASRIGKLLGRELTKSVMKIFDDTINPKHTRKR